MAASSLKRSPLTAATITQPQIVRQHSYTSSPEHSQKPKCGNATAVLATVASRTASPRRKSPPSSPLPSPAEQPSMQRRTSWEDCIRKRDGYISFPDFDQLKEEREQYRSRQ